MKLQNYRTDYQRVVHKLAQRIVEIGDTAPAHDEEESALYSLRAPDFESLPSAFGPDSATRTTDGQLQISVLAHDTSTLPPGRVSDYYGETPHTWSPYQPDYPQPVADYAANLATKCLDCKPTVGAFKGAGLGAGSNRQLPPPSLCLVDAWVTQSDAHREQLSRLNEIEESWVSVLVPWNSRDEGMSAAEQDLRGKLQAQLGRKLDSVPRRCAMAANGIPTLEDFGEVLPEMTMTILKRFRRGAPAHPPAGPFIERPRLRQADPEDFGDSHE
jgi:FxsC-like protein